MNIVGVSGNYNILWEDDVINVDTSEAAVSLYLPNIASGQVSKNFYINDVAGNAGTNAITIFAADNTVNGGESTQIDTNNGSGECVISGSTEWIVNKNTDGSGGGAQVYVLIASGEIDLSILQLNTLDFESGLSLSNTAATHAVVKLMANDTWDGNGASMLQIDNADGVSKDDVYTTLGGGSPIYVFFSGLIYGENYCLFPLVNGTNAGIFNSNENGNYYMDTVGANSTPYRIKISIYGIKTA